MRFRPGDKVLYDGLSRGKVVCEVLAIYGSDYILGLPYGYTLLGWSDARWPAYPDRCWYASPEYCEPCETELVEEVSVSVKI